jgi:thioredoxin reductase (NADPH)
MGPDLMDDMRKQAARFDTKIITETIAKVDLSKRPFQLWTENGEKIESESLIIATGATAKRMNIPGEETYWQKGISACAVCDGAVPIFRNKPLAVVGGGDSAAEEAIFLTKYASKVHVLVRRDALRASKVMQDRLFKNPKIQIEWNTVPVKATGNEKKLTGLVVKDTKTGKERNMEVNGLFYAIGHIPNTNIFQTTGMMMDKDGYIITKPGTSLTNIEGVFAAGDVQDKHYRQAITAAGSGCMAALDCERWLESQK